MVRYSISSLALPYRVEEKERGSDSNHSAYPSSNYSTSNRAGSSSRSGTGRGRGDDNAEDSDEMDMDEDVFRSTRPTEEPNKLSIEEQLEVRERVIQFTLIGLTAVVVAAVNLLIDFD